MQCARADQVRNETNCTSHVTLNFQSFHATLCSARNVLAPLLIRLSSQLSRQLKSTWYSKPAVSNNHAGPGSTPHHAYRAVPQNSRTVAVARAFCTTPWLERDFGRLKRTGLRREAMPIPARREHDYECRLSMNECARLLKAGTFHLVLITRDLVRAERAQPSSCYCTELHV